VAKYIDLIYKLLPIGRAWPRYSFTNLYKVIKAFSLEFSRVDQRVKDLIRESNPRTSFETIPEWETLLGLPDDCTKGADLNLEERRQIVLQKLITGGGSNKAFFENIADQFGYPEIEVNDFKPFRVGRASCGDPLSNEGWEYVFQVVSNDQLSQSFRTGVSSVGQPLRKFGNPIFECVIRRIKPAHTTVIFNYGGS